MANMIHHDDEVEKTARRPPEPAFGYVPITRQLKAQSEPAHDDEVNKIREETIEENDDNAEVRSQTADSTPRNDLIPLHSEDYKPFSSTASIHSYMYHLRKIYGK